MNKQQALHIAEKVGLLYLDGVYEDALAEFAFHVAAQERQACAMVVEQYTGAWSDEGYALAQAIRARGEK